MNLRTTVTVISTLVLFLVISINYGLYQKSEKERYAKNLFAISKEFDTKNGTHAKEVSELLYNTSELKKAYKADSAQLSDAQRKLKLAAQEIDNLKVKLNEADSYIKNDIVSSPDTFTVVVKDCNLLDSIKPIKTNNWDIQFKVEDCTLKVIPKYSCSITTVVDRRADRSTLRGRKRLFLARWVNPRYTYMATTTTDDKDARINDSVYIKFNKGNR